ncbi:threonine synthase [Pseudothermotoga thermarum]|uniref:Threonine synthase n=1 Tax=Pseudothermotoga thermarum DSM 5069 TaxID=688269 RepID=F7YW00_9THEM|nr:threonine synthase [Pseudothermotoga thermarum]AEH50487.1 L-threonine synthase [Pseudothermotoga thermarum DSM 5069]
MAYLGVIDRYFDFLPVKKRESIVTLKEGNTPLIRASNLEKHLGLSFELYLKYEGMNPTGSFKDRGMTVAISVAVENGATAVICASTGNTAASAAAYAARAGLKCAVLIPKDAVAIGKLAQAIAYGAKVIAVEGNFDDALKLVREFSEKFPVTVVNSINPNRIEGQKTAAFEICDEFLDAPDYLAIPVGNAGNITAYWKGFKEYFSIGKISKLPKMLGFQAAGAAPIVEGRIIENPKTIATAIRIGNPASWKSAVNAVQESCGLVDKVTDEEILQAYQLLAKKEGIFVEPASAASVAGVIKYFNKGYFQKNSKVVCVLTGHGLKDPDTAMKIGISPVVIPPEIKALEKAIYDGE